MNVEAARSQNIDNRLKGTEANIQIRCMKREYRDSKRRPRPTSEQIHRLAKEATPRALNPGQYNPITGQITWPTALMLDEFEEYRETLDDLFWEKSVASGTLSLRQINQGAARPRRCGTSCERKSTTCRRRSLPKAAHSSDSWIMRPRRPACNGVRVPPLFQLCQERSTTYQREDFPMRTLNFLTALTCLLAIATRSPGQDEAAALSQQLSSTDVQTRLTACRDLAQLGVKAQGAVPQLIKLLRANDVDEQRLAALTLASVGESAAAAVPALMDNLTAKDAQARAAAAYALGKIGPAARAAAPALVTAAADEDSMVRHQVLAALRNIDPPHDLVVPLFAKMLGSVNSGEAATLADTLADAGAAAVPELVRALADKGAAYWACLALAEIGPPAAPAVPALGKLLRSDEAEVRMQALVALAAIGEASRPLAPQISELVNQDKWSSVRYSAAYALGAIGDKTVALPALVPAMNDDDEFLRVTAAWAYVRLAEGGSSPDLEKAIATVVAGAVSTNYRVRDIAVRALADPDLPAELAAPAMKNALQGIEDPAQRMDIVDALASLARGSYRVASSHSSRRARCVTRPYKC